MPLQEGVPMACGVTTVTCGRQGTAAGPAIADLPRLLIGARRRHLRPPGTGAALAR